MTCPHLTSGGGFEHRSDLPVEKAWQQACSTQCVAAGALAIAQRWSCLGRDNLVTVFIYNNHTAREAKRRPEQK